MTRNIALSIRVNPVFVNYPAIYCHRLHIVIDYKYLPYLLTNYKNQILGTRVTILEQYSKVF